VLPRPSPVVIPCRDPKWLHAFHTVLWSSIVSRHRGICRVFHYVIETHADSLSEESAVRIRALHSHGRVADRQSARFPHRLARLWTTLIAVPAFDGPQSVMNQLVRWAAAVGRHSTASGLETCLTRYSCKNSDL
jgi:hypothetical protein